MTRRRSEKAAQSELLIQQALDGIAAGTYETVYQAAKQIGVSYMTLLRRSKGGKSRVEGHEQYQILAPAEEQVLAKWIGHLTSMGHPVRHAFLREMVEEIRRNRHSGINNSAKHITYVSIGDSWVQRFLQRHPHLQTVMGQAIEASRLKETSADVINHWFDTFMETIEENKITMENVYNIDETGFSIGTVENARVIVDSNVRTKYQAQPGRQEWVTAVECVCADGSSIAPLIIFKGEKVLSSWIPKELPENWHISCNSKGWSSNMHGYEWLRKCFEPLTAEKAKGQMRLLICDGHDSHISAEFVRHCMTNQIILLLLPPHSSHLLQPLDVGVFGPLKKAISRHLAGLLQTEIVRIQKFEWLEKYIKARAEALSTSNIQGGWRGAGLFPFHRSRVLRNLPLEIQTEGPSTPPPTQYNAEPTTLFDTSLLTSSPPDATVLQSANTALKELLTTMNGLNTPARKYVPRLADTTERLRATVSILQHENKELKEVLGARVERKSGKRLALKGVNLVTTEEIHKRLAEAEKATEEKKRKKSSKRRHTPSPSTSEDQDDCLDPILRQISDCIEVVSQEYSS